MPTVAKIMCMKGHCGLAPCRTCCIYGCLCPPPATRDGVASYYYPVRPPLGWDQRPVLRRDCLDGPEYNPAHLPLRNHTAHLAQVKAIEAARNKKDAMRAFSINSRSIFLNQSSVNFPQSFPLGFAHQICLNTIPNLVRHAIGKFPTVPNIGEPYAVDLKVWENLTRQLAASTSTIPASFGRLFRNLSSEMGSLVAEDWLNFLLYAARPLFATIYTTPRTRPYLDLWNLLAETVEDCLLFSIHRVTVESIATRFEQFVT
ncbi:hypothetical protein BOTBODRAFT_111138 [Botryobasidium botryosum FD-172 SS1]|uniref:Uncharacterized protein n=1 Tax=Botryobasidium botryosum (strain FD-172 SS1) TaxID=930990 RepID=A0A067MPS5_BOTB1|nr:hypothetical protein BOTBODRAFT_111138 [Botryobasidium botryosum FD-172 SS1]